MSDQLQFQIALTMVPQVGTMTAKSLIAYCGSAEAVFRAKKQELTRIPGIGAATAEQILVAKPMHLAEKELFFLDQHDVDALFFADSSYPARLKARPDCPIILYHKGSDRSLLDSKRVVAIVGTRQPTEHGRAICEEIVADLQPYGAIIISGLAYGVDITAHRKSTAIGMPNFGVLGHGLSSIYPATHRPTAVKMIENGGLLTEYVHTAGPDREHFPQRNRIIAGLADTLVVIETAETGGSMISADIAERYGCDLFAVPGRPRDAKSIGCNLLLKTGRARLIESAADIAIAKKWGVLSAPTGGFQSQLFVDLTPEEQSVEALVKANPDIMIDDLIAISGMQSGEIAAIILALEFKGVIRTLPGKRYRAI